MAQNDVLFSSYVSTYFPFSVNSYFVNQKNILTNNQHYQLTRQKYLIAVQCHNLL